MEGLPNKSFALFCRGAQTLSVWFSFKKNYKPQLNDINKMYYFM